MKDELTKKIQENAYQIFAAFHNICEDHQIKYSMAYGTLLGAVRHKGFIPWDDDIDVFMTQEEYKKLKKAFKSEEFELLDWENDKKYPYLFPKIRKKGTSLVESEISDLDYNLGVYIDIFILYQIPNTVISQKVKALHTKIAYKLYRLKQLNLSSMGRATRIVARLAKPFLNLNKLIALNNKIYARSTGDYMRDATMFDPRTYIKTEEINSLTKIVFEDIEAYVCTNYHEILTRQYGNYMQLPPEDQRVSVHNFYNLEI